MSEHCVISASFFLDAVTSVGKLTVQGPPFLLGFCWVIPCVSVATARHRSGCRSDD